MNSEILKGKWEVLKGRVKEIYGDLTDSDEHKISGAYQEAMGYLQQKYGETKESVETKLMKLLDKKDDRKGHYEGDHRDHIVAPGSDVIHPKEVKDPKDVRDTQPHKADHSIDPKNPNKF